jgi:hypothetical protein
MAVKYASWAEQEKMRAREFVNDLSSIVLEDIDRAEAQANYMQGECMILAVAINQYNPQRYPIGYIWEYNVDGIPDMQLDDDEWEDLTPEEQQEVSDDPDRRSLVHAFVFDRKTNEYIDARGRHQDLPNLWRKSVTRFEKFPGTARELIDITSYGEWDEASQQVDFKRGKPAFDHMSGTDGLKRALDYAIKYLGVEGSENSTQPPSIKPEETPKSRTTIPTSKKQSQTTQRPHLTAPETQPDANWAVVRQRDGQPVMYANINTPEKAIDWFDRATRGAKANTFELVPVKLRQRPQQLQLTAPETQPDANWAVIRSVDGYPVMYDTFNTPEEATDWFDLVAGAAKANTFELVPVQPQPRSSSLPPRSLDEMQSSSTGERRQMAQWQLNMRRGRNKKK